MWTRRVAPAARAAPLLRHRFRTFRGRWALRGGISRSCSLLRYFSINYDLQWGEARAE